MLEVPLQNIRQQLQAGFDVAPFERMLGMMPPKLRPKNLIEQRNAAANILAKIGGGVYWKKPHGEPIWVEIPQGEFWMGSEYGGEDERPQHRLFLDSFQISPTPITNIQYSFFVKETGHPAPWYWEDNSPPKELKSHPVVWVTWYDAMAYCQWLSKVIGLPITLPSEAQWERTARGNKDRRDYPWGDTFEVMYCNNEDLGLRQTTPVGIFPHGASPDGCLDIAGNVWEWTRSVYRDYPYNPLDGRENLQASGYRVLRGGAFSNHHQIGVGCTVRYNFDPFEKNNCIGFRVVLSPNSSSFN